MKRCLFPVVLLATVILTGCGSPITAKRTMSLSVSHVADAPLAIDTRNGAVTIEVDSSLTSVEIEARIRCEGATLAEAEARAAASTVAAERESDQGRLTIVPRIDGHWRRNDSCSIHVRMPGVTGVMIDTTNGAVTIRNTSGEAVVSTSNGRIEATGHRGPLTLDTNNGSIAVTEVLGSVRAETSNGAVQVTLAEEAAGPVEIDTSNGAVSLTVGNAFAGRLTVRTSNGRVNYFNPNDGNRLRASGVDALPIVIGTGGPRSSISTSNGSVTVRHR